MKYSGKSCKFYLEQIFRWPYGEALLRTSFSDLNMEEEEEWKRSSLFCSDEIGYPPEEIRPISAPFYGVYEKWEQTN